MRTGISTSTVERFRGRGPTLGVFDAFFNAASAGLAVFDDQLRYVQINNVLAQINGKSVVEHIGRSIGEVVPDAAESMEPPLRHVLRSGEAIDKLPFELRGRSYVATFFPVLDDVGVVRGVGGIIMDVTEQRRLESELRSAVELRERVLAVVSHDLRNPLNTIELAMSTMPAAVMQDKDAARRVDIIKRAANVMENLIGDLLDVATIHAGKLTLRLSDETASALIHDAVELHAALAAEKQISLVDESRLHGVTLRCDRVRIMQVLGNLIGNSIKFCNRGDRIAIRGEADTGSLVIEVGDTGPGIPAADLPHLFEPYWTTARGRERGTGLGLFISKAIVDAHHGSIRVDSVVGNGTTFRLYLPLG